MIKFWLSLTALLSLAALAGAGQAAPSSGPGSERPLGDIIGLNVKFAQGQPMSDLPELKDLTRQLGAWTLMRQIAGVGYPTSSIQAYLFRGPAGAYKVAAWDIDGVVGPSPAVITGAGAALQAVDDLGQPITLEQAKNGVIKLSLGQGPVYFSGASAGMTIAAGSAE